MLFVKVNCRNTKTKYNVNIVIMGTFSDLVWSFDTLEPEKMESAENLFYERMFAILFRYKHSLFNVKLT